MSVAYAEENYGILVAVGRGNRGRSDTWELSGVIGMMASQSSSAFLIVRFL